MADFEALIKAKLDTTGITGQIKSEIESKEINLTPNTNGLVADIQNALKNGNFTVDVKLGNINPSSVQTKAQKTGATVGKTIANAANSQLDNLKLDFDATNIKNLENRLKSLGFSEGSIAKITQGLNEMSLVIDKITTKVSGGDLSITVKGTNEVGDAVTILEKYSAETDEVVTKSETLSRSFKETGDQISSLQVIKLENKMKTWLEKHSAAAKDYGESIQALYKDLEGISESSPDAASRLKEIDTKFQEIQQSAIAAGKAGQSFGTKLKNAFSGIIGVVSVSSVLKETVSILKDMYQEVYEIDTAMIELKKVTDETASRYNKFLSGAGDVAKEIGTTIANYVTSTADFARLGYDFESSQELAKVANIYNVVGDDISSIEDATQSIISTMTAFNISAKDSISIVDKYNEVDLLASWHRDVLAYLMCDSNYIG